MRKIFKSFAARLTFYILTLAFLIFGCIAAVFFSYAKEREQQQAMLYTAALQQNVIQSIEAEFDDIVTAVSIAAGQVDDMEHTPDSVMNVAHNVLRSNRLLKGVGIAFRPGFYPQKGRLFMEYLYEQGKNNLLYQHYGEGIDDYTQRSWYRKANASRKAFWTEPYTDNGNKSDIMVSYVCPCTDDNGRIYAVIMADVRLNEFTESLKAQRPYPGSYSFILDNKTGKYVSHPDKQYILATDYKVRAKLIDCPDLRGVGDRMVKNGTGAVRSVIDGDDVLLSYAPIKSLGWSVCSVNKYSDIMENLGSATFAVLAILLVGLLMLSLCIRLLVKHTSKPIRELTEAAYKIARGNLTAELPVVETKDDLRQLHDAFANMQKSLVGYIEELKATTQAKSRIESELSIAHSIQMSLVPKIFSPFPDCKELDLYACLNPAKEVGGDFYDFFLSGGKLYFVIGDVSGKGIPASLVMAITRTLFRIISATTESPAEIMGKLNDAISKDNEANMFVTMFAGVLDYTTGELTYCNAGHNPPCILTAGQGVGFMKVRQNLPLGVFEGFAFEEQTLTLHKGDGMFLYTDGLTEAENADKAQFGEDRMTEALNECRELMAKETIEDMNGRLTHFVGDAEQSDDLTLLCFRLNNDAPADGWKLVMDNNVEDTSRLYPFIEGICESLNTDASLMNSINLAVEEAVVNSVMYAYGDGNEGKVELTAEFDAAKRSLSFVLTDSGLAFDPLEVPEADTSLDVEERPIGGLGVFLVKQIMDNVEYKRQDGKNILIMTKNI